MKEEIMQVVKAELKAAHDREISKFVKVMRVKLETIKIEIIRDLKKGKGVDASAKPHVEHADISEGDDDSNEELPDDLDLGSTYRGMRLLAVRKRLTVWRKLPRSFYLLCQRQRMRLGEVT